MIYRIARALFKLFFKLFYNHNVLIPEGMVFPKSAIVAANHCSFLDPPLIAASFNEEVFYLAGSHLFKNRFFAKLIEHLNAHPVARGSSDRTALMTVLTLLERGKKVLIFPEGTRSEDGVIKPFKRGLGLIAEKSGRPIVPAYIHGTFDAWPKGKKFPSFIGKKTAIAFGQPIYPTGSNNRKEQELLTQRVYEEIQSLKKMVEGLYDPK